MVVFLNAYALYILNAKLFLYIFIHLIIGSTCICMKVKQYIAIFIDVVLN